MSNLLVTGIHLFPESLEEEQSEKKESGIVPGLSELDVLLQELIELDLSEEDRNNENQEKNKNEEDRVKALDIRKTPMEKLSETKTRKVNDGEEEVPKKKSRPSVAGTIAYLKEKTDMEFHLRQHELELKKTTI